MSINKGQLPTRNISKPGDVGKFNFCEFTQKLNGLIGWFFKIPASTYCYPMGVIFKKYYFGFLNI